MDSSDERADNLKGILTLFHGLGMNPEYMHDCFPLAIDQYLFHSNKKGRPTSSEGRLDRRRSDIGRNQHNFADIIGTHWAGRASQVCGLCPKQPVPHQQQRLPPPLRKQPTEGYMVHVRHAASTSTPSPGSLSSVQCWNRYRGGRRSCRLCSFHMFPVAVTSGRRRCRR